MALLGQINSVHTEIENLLDPRCERFQAEGKLRQIFQYIKKHIFNIENISPDNGRTVFISITMSQVGISKKIVEGHERSLTY